MIAQPRTAGEEWKAHWPMVFAAMSGMSFYTVVTYAGGAFMVPVTKEFGWSREQFSIGITLFAAIATIGGPFLGTLLDRIGTRAIGIFGTIATGVGLAMFSLSTGSASQWIALWVVYGLVALCTKSTVWAAGVSNVFASSRGLALATMLSGSALGQVLAPILATQLIAGFGWRAAYVWMAAGWAGISVILLVLFYRDGRDPASRRAAAASSLPVDLPGMTIAQGFRDQRLIRICIANVVMATMGSGVTFHLVPLIHETGVSMRAAGLVAASGGIGGFVGKFLTGWLLDRRQGSLVPFSSYAVAAIGYLLLLGTLHSTVALAIGAMILGYASGAGLQVSTYLVSRYAGMRAFGTLFGTIASAMMLGTAIGPILAARVHDVTGSYHALLIGAVPVMLLCALLFVGLGPYPRFGTPEPREEALIEAELAQ